MELPCGRAECVYKAIEKMLDKMKSDVAKKQNITYPEQVMVARIYEIVSNQLAEACRRKFEIKPENCIPNISTQIEKISMDTFILLKSLKEDEIITEDYQKNLFDILVGMNPELKEQVEKDRDKGLI